MPRLFFSLLLLLLLSSCASSQDNPPPQDGPQASGCWSEVALPETEEGTVILNGIHAFSESDIWAVGQRTLPDGERAVTLAMRWDGSAGTVVPTPSLSDARGAKSHLYAVGGSSAEDVWAVGAHAEDGAHFSGLAMRWDGTEWQVHETPSPGKVDNTIYAVAAAAPDDAWAVGSYIATEHADAHMMALHWDGAKWEQADLSHVKTHNLLAVTAPARGQAWAVGTEVLRWQGQKWEVQAIPEEVSGAYFDGVAASEDGSMAWAVGNDGNEAVALFWNGARWSGGVTPRLDDGPYPHDVAALSPTEVWAVGEYAESPLDRQMLLLRWDGTRWHTAPNPLPGKNTRLLSVTRAGTELWAAGAQGLDDQSKGLMMRYGECR